MKTIGNKSVSDNLAISDEILLMFNEHDTRITLNWEPGSPDVPPHEGVVTVILPL